MFYPQGLPQRRELEYASRHFPTVEINGTFYSLQRPEYYAQWYRETPPGFTFAVKGSRYITHLLRLKNIDLRWREPIGKVRFPRVKLAYGPRVTRGDPAWEQLGRR